MNKSQFLVIYTKDSSNWSLHVAGPINESIYGLSTKDQAKYIWKFIKRSYDQGRYDEFKDNNNKSDTLMKRFGL